MSSTVGSVNVGVLNSILKIAIDIALIPQVNQLLGPPGVPLPAQMGMKLINVDISLGSGFFSIHSDLTYTP